MSKSRRKRVARPRAKPLNDGLARYDFVQRLIAKLLKARAIGGRLDRDKPGLSRRSHRSHFDSCHPRLIEIGRGSGNTIPKPAPQCARSCWRILAKPATIYYSPSRLSTLRQRSALSRSTMLVASWHAAGRQPPAPVLPAPDETIIEPEARARQQQHAGHAAAQSRHARARAHGREGRARDSRDGCSAATG